MSTTRIYVELDSTGEKFEI